MRSRRGRKTREKSRQLQRSARCTGRAVLVALALILATGAALRVAYLDEHRDLPDFDTPLSDAGFHDYWARGIAFGAWETPHGQRDPLIRETPYQRPPGYPYLLALVYRASGGSYLAPRILQLCLGVLSAFLAYVLGRRYFGTIAGLVSAALASWYWIFIYFEGELHAVSVLIPVVLGLILLLSTWTEGVRARLSLGAGLLLGSAVLLRPTAVALLAAAALWALWLRRSGVRRALTRGLLPLAIAAAVVVLPTTLRNYAVSGDFVPVVSTAGINLYMGNNPNATGLVEVRIPDLGTYRDCFEYPALLDALSEEVGSPLSHAEASSHFMRRALEYIRTHPGRTARLLWKKTRLYWGPHEIAHNRAPENVRLGSTPLRRAPVTHALILALAMLGVLSAVVSRRLGRDTPLEQRRRDANRGWQVLVLVSWSIGLWFLAVLPFFVSARYRAPMVALLAVLAGWAAQWLWRQWASRKWTLLVAGIAVGIALYAVASVDYPEIRTDPGHHVFVEGYTCLMQGRVDEAFDLFQEALDISPHHWRCHSEIGLIYLRRGDFDRGIEHLRAALRGKPDYAPAHFNLSLALRHVGEFEESLRHAEEVLRINPDFPRGRRLR
ncbi:MAG: tetratricopeptide repeat protein, partial [Candidatus Eisenbacteria bacterium]|nr:tetratricopeptide repeat protein [Candidatus Eisenbacteria bacterium]